VKLVTADRPAKTIPLELVEEKQDIKLFVRPGVAEDLVLLNSWFQNPVVNRFSQMPKSWSESLRWWRGLGQNTVISVVVILEKDDPMSFYCGRSIGYIEWSHLDQELPFLWIVVGDWSLSAMGIGSKMFEMAGEQLAKLKESGKFYSIIHPDHKIALSFAQKYQEEGIIQDISTTEKGWIKVVGDFGCVK